MLDLLPATIRLEDIRTGVSFGREEFVRLCYRRCEELIDAGLKPGDRVGLCHREALSLLVDLFAAWQVGATVVPMSISLLSGERQRLADRFELKVWISDQALPTLASLKPASTDHRGGRTNRPSAGVELDSPALILLTSGTTAEPKGVVLSKRALFARLCLNIERIGNSILSHSLVMLPLHFGHGLIGNALTPLLAGQKLVLWTEPAIEGLSGLGSLLDKYEITFLSSVPSMWRVALRISKPPTRNSLQRVHVGSEPLPPDLWRAIVAWAGGVPVYNMYGISEAANWICGEDGANCNFTAGSVGHAWGGMIRVEQDEANSPSDRDRGEIIISTPGVMTGYWNDPSGTANAIQHGWFRTGDIGEIDTDGGLRIVGRIKHQINRGGVKISAEEIDALLRDHPDVEDACGFALPDPIAGEVVGAVVIAKDTHQIDPSELKRWCAERVRAEAVPHKILQVSAIPRSERGKVRRDAVREMFLSIQRDDHEKRLEARP
jgi:acyl-CoA synthetase (AMP-forming)/AMP-acid ligase II